MIVRYWCALAIWKLRWWRWFFGLPGYRLGDPLLGPGDLSDPHSLRRRNRDIIVSRYETQEPQRPEKPLRTITKRPPTWQLVLLFVGILMLWDFGPKYLYRAVYVALWTIAPAPFEGAQIPR